MKRAPGIARSEIEQYLRAGSTGTPKEIAEALHVNRCTVLWNLRNLKRDGLARVVGLREVTGRDGKAKPEAHIYGAGEGLPPTDPRDVVAAAMNHRSELELAWSAGRLQ